KDRYMTVAGGQTADINGVTRNPDILFDTQTGQPVQMQQQDLPVGTVSTVGNKKAIWDGSKWIPQ
ncbi:hypothetical protein NL350_28530, partial [Klebsiella pneumoniae]|nr:hypothetical protein [Klebsiella pneumoniae]